MLTLQKYRHYSEHNKLCLACIKVLETARRKSTGLLLDVNNLYLSYRNTALDLTSYLESLDPNLMDELTISLY